MKQPNKVVFNISPLPLSFASCFVNKNKELKMPPYHVSVPTGNYEYITMGKQSLHLFLDFQV
jgi:hypothetical protein